MPPPATRSAVFREEAAGAPDSHFEHQVIYGNEKLA
jgi:hypothetical protein